MVFNFFYYWHLARDRSYIRCQHSVSWVEAYLQIFSIFEALHTTATLHTGRINAVTCNSIERTPTNFSRTKEKIITPLQFSNSTETEKIMKELSTLTVHWNKLTQTLRCSLLLERYFFPQYFNINDLGRIDLWKLQKKICI